jgi:hypothetical protein
MTRLCIYVDFEDDSDLEWIRNKVLPAVEEKIEELKEEDPYRLDSSPESLDVSWEQEEE